MKEFKRQYGAKLIEQLPQTEPTSLTPDGNGDDVAKGSNVQNSTTEKRHELGRHPLQHATGDNNGKPAIKKRKPRGDVATYCPDAGDIIWLDFLQPVANEQAGQRPAKDSDQTLQRHPFAPAGSGRQQSMIAQPIHYNGRRIAIPEECEIPQKTQTAPL